MHSDLLFYFEIAAPSLVEPSLYWFVYFLFFKSIEGNNLHSFFIMTLNVGREFFLQYRS
jgi:hypothetical protein